jgi:hypothetical protein
MVEKDNRKIRAIETLELTDEDCQVFIQSLLEPPAPNDFLIKVAEQYQKEVLSK